MLAAKLFQQGGYVVHFQMRRPVYHHRSRQRSAPIGSQIVQPNDAAVNFQHFTIDGLARPGYAECLSASTVNQPLVQPFLQPAQS